MWWFEEQQKAHLQGHRPIIPKEKRRDAQKLLANFLCISFALHFALKRPPASASIFRRNRSRIPTFNFEPDNITGRVLDVKINPRPEGVTLGCGSARKPRHQIFIFNNAVGFREVEFNIAFNQHAHLCGFFLCFASVDGRTANYIVPV